jgi:peptide/nickel transport system substrate-binding protein
MLILNNQRPPFSDIKLRQAVSFAIDREETMQALTNGFGKVVNDIWDEKSFWYMPFPAVQRDLEKVKTLLKAAGHENGLDVTLHVKPAYLNVAQVVQDQLNKAQIRTKLVVLDWVSMKPKLLKNEFDMAVSSAGSYADPDGRYGRFYAHDGPANYFAGGYANPKVDELLEKGREEVDPKMRKEIYTEIWKIVDEEVPHVILYMAPMTHAWRKRVQNFKVSVEGDIAFDGGGLAYVWLSE